MLIVIRNCTLSRYWGNASKTVCSAFLISGLLATPVLSNQTLSNSKIGEAKNHLSLNKAIRLALKNDPWLAGSHQQQKEMEAKAIASAILPDPKFNLGLANLATDSFEFNQENMSQLKFGASQMLPRGDSLRLKEKKFTQLSQALPLQRQDRRAQLTLQVSQLWLDTYKAQESLALILKNRPLFEQLIDVAQSKYSTASGKTRQQDVVRAQLELTRLDDRATEVKLRQEAGLAKLSQWTSEAEPIIFHTNTPYRDKTFTRHLGKELPRLKLGSAQEITIVSKTLRKHPAVLALDKHIAASQTEINLAEQNYKPQLGFNIAYGYRDDAPSGMKRADFVSFGLGFDLPFLNGKGQDQEVHAAAARAESTKTRKWLLLRKLYADFEATNAKVLRLKERQQIYHSRLLPQMLEQSEASLNAYTHDVGDFSEVVRSRIAELNALIDFLSIQVDRQKSIAQLNYFLAGETQLSTGDQNE